MWQFIALIVVGLLQITLGFAGIEYHLGGFWAFAAIVAALWLRFLLPVTIGSYFGAVDVMGWEWYVGVAIAAPGLLFVVPSMVMVALDGVRTSAQGTNSTESGDRTKNDDSKPPATTPTINIWHVGVIAAVVAVAYILFLSNNEQSGAGARNSSPTINQQTKIETVYLEILDNEWVLGFDGRNSTLRVMIKNKSRFTIDAPEIRVKMESCGSNRFMIRTAQQALNQFGFNAGSIDGIIGNRTRAAIAEFQTSKGLPVSRQLDAATIEALGVSQEAESFPSLGRGLIVGGYEIPSGNVAYVDFINLYSQTRGRDFCFHISRDVIVAAR